MEVTSKFHKLWEGYLRDRLFIVCFFAVLYYYASDQLTLVPGVLFCFPLGLSYGNYFNQTTRRWSGEQTS